MNNSRLFCAWTTRTILWKVSEAWIIDEGCRLLTGNVERWEIGVTWSNGIGELRRILGRRRDCLDFSSILNNSFHLYRRRWPTMSTWPDQMMISLNCRSTVVTRVGICLNVPCTQLAISMPWSVHPVHLPVTVVYERNYLWLIPNLHRMLFNRQAHSTLKSIDLRKEKYKQSSTTVWNDSVCWILMSSKRCSVHSINNYPTNNRRCSTVWITSVVCNLKVSSPRATDRHWLTPFFFQITGRVNKISSNSAKTAFHFTLLCPFLTHLISAKVYRIECFWLVHDSDRLYYPSLTSSSFLVLPLINRRVERRQRTKKFEK